MLSRSSAPTGVDAVLFDFDGVLVDDAAAIEEAWRHLGRKLSRAGEDRLRVRREWRKNSPKLLRLVEAGEISPREYYFRRFHDVLSEEGRRRDGFVDELNKCFVDERAKACRTIPGALDLLRELRASGIAVGLLTNGFPDVQRPKLERTGIAERVDRDKIVICGELGWYKPDPRPFQVALARLGLPAKRVVMVGDSLGSDIEPAKKLRFAAAILVDRRNRHPRVTPRVRDIREIPERLRRLAN